MKDKEVSNHLGQTWFCPCGKSVKCQECQKNFSPSIPEPPVFCPKETENILSGWRCPNCGTVVSPHVSICPNCSPIKYTITCQSM